MVPMDDITSPRSYRMWGAISGLQLLYFIDDKIETLRAQGPLILLPPWAQAVVCSAFAIPSTQPGRGAK